VRALAVAIRKCSASMASPFGIKSRRRARTISGKASLSPKMGLATIQIFGEYLDCQDLIFPGSAGTPAALSGRSSCFWGSFSE
jgi:hypothetical protein